MKKLLPEILVPLFLCNLVWGQFKADVSRPNVPEALIQSPSSGVQLFSPQWFSMNHSFSLSMVSTGFGLMGLGAYTNEMNFQLRPNLELTTFFTLTQSSLSAGIPQRGLSLDQMGVGARLEYHPTQNTHFSILLQKAPTVWGSYPQNVTPGWR
ncbi:MAG: hypothetical protein D6762_04920 [Candidatus Neomarinimicrobiota bacterium]|nr:MAG: hypothetical protein D6762_04920 [Candidatus Neomarinimicrobiota bacterium]